MQARLRAGSVAALLVLAVCASCSRRNLNLGTGSFLLDGGSGGTADGASDAPPSTSDAAPADGAVIIGGSDAAESACVTAAVQLPWTATTTAALRLDVATTANAVAVMSRQAKQTDVRTYTRAGAVISGFQFGADAQFLPYSDTRFLLIARGTTGDFVATAIDPDLHTSTRLYTATANATEHMLGAIALSSTAIVLVTDEHFVNLATGAILPWSTVLGAADADAFSSARIFGMASQPDRVLLAWGAGATLRLAVVDAGGTLLTRADDPAFFGSFGTQTAAAAKFGDGLLLFDGNPVRITQVGFDLSRDPIGQSTQLRTFYRAAPAVAAIALQGRPVAFWLTVFPGTDNSQGSTSHQLYGCELDLAAPANCVGTALIAATGLDGYAIPQQPVAAAAFPDAAFAIAHTDAAGGSWLRLANLGCALRGP
jgi:hypothetical protein